MKRVVRVDAEMFARIRESIRDDELAGIDPGAYWAKLYPGATEVEFIVEDCTTQISS